ncbi:MAG: nucleoside triphosphate pyrophosphohydrolase, partial [Acidimicrobiaceae bacterium]|nr:nucleoside triphosphate pyrophosphohydrolase [Acidimicrobiaceae bacterium]
PHVLGDVDVSTAAEVESRWEELKRAEKGRESVTDGIPPGLPALALVQKLARRGAGVGLAGPLATSGDSLVVDLVQPVSPETLASALETLVELGSRAGLDVEGVLRDRARDVRERIREHEGVSLT